MDPLLPLGSLVLGLGSPSPSSSPCGGASLSVGSGSGSPPPPSSPQLMHRSETTDVYRLYGTGFKVLLAQEAPSEEQVLKLLHEQRISNYLPWSCHKRKVTDVTTFNKRPALSFKWASGVTLKEWLQKVEDGPQEADRNVRLRAAMAISKTLSDFHDGGVAYNSLTPENVILSPVEGECVATLIDLSKAIIFKGDGGEDGNGGGPAFEVGMKQADLKGLGMVLDKLFRGEEQGGNPEEAGGLGSADFEGADLHLDSGRRKRGKQQSLGEGLPLYLSSLISALVDESSSPDHGYRSAKDVYLDLKTYADNPDGCFCQSQLDDAMARSQLRLPRDLFYGRQVQMSMLMHLFQSCVALGKEPLMAIISGYPGTGKSTLVNQIKKPLLDLNGCFIEGKFDKSTRPDTILASALNGFFGNIMEARTGNHHMSMKWRIHDAIGSGCDALLELLPNLQKWMADGTMANESIVSNKEKGMGSSHRFKFMFCKILGAISCRNHPVILFLDDLQWADETTLDIIRMMMTDPDLRHFLFLGCYRDNEVDTSHPLTSKFNAIREQGVSIVTIEIGPIEKKCVNTLLSEVLCLPPSLCLPLANVVHSRTGGIILFILRFLVSLNAEGDLYFSMTTRRWMYNLEKISVKEIHKDVVTHMTEHMKSLSSKMRMGLKVAACLGPNFEAKVLEKAKKDNEIEDSFLKSCVDFGFLQSTSFDKYKWAHDQIQQAAYELIPLPKRESFHLLLGSRLFMATSSEEMESLLFYIVDNMNRGAQLIDDQDSKYDVSQLNLDAGEKAISSSAFHSAAKYLMKGLSLLGPDSWDVKYNLTIRLYDAASEALFVTGKFSMLSEMIEEPLNNARSLEDKLNVLNNFIRSLAASAEYERGILRCLQILAFLGEVIPKDVTPNIYSDEISQVKKLLDGKSRQELITLPMMTETSKLAALQFMNHAMSMTYITKPLLNPILVFRMVKMSIEHGICNISAFAFACYGAWLVSEPNDDVEGGHMMGRVALEIQKKLGAIEMTPRCYASIYGMINIWKEPWQAGQSKHLEAYESGGATGDMEYSLTNLYLYSNTAIYCCGENLETLSHNMASHAKRAFQFNARVIWQSLVILHQLALDLIGTEQNAFGPYSNGMTEESCFTKCNIQNEVSICRLICLKKKYVAFFKGDLDTAADMRQLGQNYPLGSTGRLAATLVSIFIDGLIGFFLARKHREDETSWTNIGLDAIGFLRKWVKSSEWNFSNKLYLLEAEYYFLRKVHERALASYNSSITAAREHRFVHEEGLAEEKLAAYLLHKGRYDEAMVHYTNAKKCYENWGAYTLVQRVEKVIAILLPLCTGAF